MQLFLLFFLKKLDLVLQNYDIVVELLHLQQIGGVFMPWIVASHLIIDGFNQIIPLIADFLALLVHHEEFGLSFVDNVLSGVFIHLFEQ